MPVCERFKRRHVAITIAALCLATGRPVSAFPPVPAALSALLSAQGVTKPVSAWCQGEFRAGRPAAFAVALQSGDGGGAYVVIDAGTPIVELGTYARQPALDCYSRADADKLDDAIRRSQTIHGRVTPRWKTAVVCGFGDDTSATCWQYSPADGTFVEIGRWIT